MEKRYGVIHLQSTVQLSKEAEAGGLLEPSWRRAWEVDGERKKEGRKKGPAR